MENPQGLNAEVQKPPIKPIIEYDPGLQEKDVPYDVSVDPDKCTNLFREFGMSDEAIKKFKIEITRKPLFRRSPVGEYSSMDGDKITIYADVLWNRHQKYLDQDRKRSLFEKGVSSVIKVSGGEYETPIGLFLHESKHAFDARSESVKSLLFSVFQLTYYLGGVIGVGVAIDRSIPITPLNELLSPLAIFSAPFLYAANPYEIRARRFAVKNRDDPRWQNILTITPKPKQR